MDKVLCSFCRFENNRRCIKKNSKVSINKKRLCDAYEDDDDKLRRLAERKLKASKPTVYMRPDWYWDRKNFIKKMKQEQAAKEESQPSVFTGDPEHPLTGDLSRFFKSTVGDEEKSTEK